MKHPADPGRASIVGAGLSGTAMATCLARQGFEVEVYELREDPRLKHSLGSSMNLGLSRRGIHALGEIGVLDQVMQMAIPMYGRMIHSADGRQRFQSYGRQKEQAIYAIQRNQLNEALIEFAEGLGKIRFSFGHKLERLDKRRCQAFFRIASTGQRRESGFQWLVGADGVHSSVRDWMHRGLRADFQREYLPWGWKELTIPAATDGSFPFEKNAFHLWPRGQCMLFAHPNPNGTFTCSLVMLFEGETSFAALSSAARLEGFFHSNYRDVAERVPNLAEQFERNPIIKLVGIRTSHWYDRSRIVLIGDAAHAVVPFYAQGMNAAFEDCLTLSQCLARHPGDRQGAFARYQALRQRHADALAEMSKRNFVELRDRVRSPSLRLRKRLDALLGKLAGDAWMPLHDIVTHTLMPYAEAAQRARRQDRIVRWAAVLACLALVALLVQEISQWVSR